MKTIGIIGSAGSGKTSAALGAFKDVLRGGRQILLVIPSLDQEEYFRKRIDAVNYMNVKVYSIETFDDALTKDNISGIIDLTVVMDDIPKSKRDAFVAKINMSSKLNKRVTHLYYTDAS